MFHPPFISARLAIGTATVMLCAGANAEPVQVTVTVTVESLVPATSVTFAELHVGFHSGAFDAFRLGQPAADAIVSVAERGDGVQWLQAFAAADPAATVGTVQGLLLPGLTRSASFTVDPVLNRFFTFAAMVMPSNDFFIGNDFARQYRLFSASGSLRFTSIVIKANEIWDAGSEAFDPLAAAFIVGSTNSLRTLQNSVVALNFAELAAFNGVTTRAGYIFNGALAADTEVYRISFSLGPAL